MKRIVIIYFLLICNVSTFAQGWVTDDAVKDSSDGVFTGIFGVLLFLGLIWVIGYLMDKKSENDDLSGKHKYDHLPSSSKVSKDNPNHIEKHIIQNDATTNNKLHKDEFDKEAEYVLGKAAHYGLIRGNSFLHDISWSECYREWFYQGYKDGKRNGEKQQVLKGDTIEKFEIVSWEEYVDMKFSNIAKSQELTDKLCNGDITKARKAYVNGRTRGIRYKDKTVDGYMQIT